MAFDNQQIFRLIANFAFPAIEGAYAGITLQQAASFSATKKREIFKAVSSLGTVHSIT